MPVTVGGMRHGPDSDYHRFPKSARTSHPNAGHGAPSPSCSRLCQPRQCPRTPPRRGEAARARFSASLARLVRPLPTRNLPPPCRRALFTLLYICCTGPGLSARGSATQFHGSEWVASSCLAVPFQPVRAKMMTS
jgi:hypothetical protein